MLFFKYLKEKIFMDADMARKYLQMGFTRSRRYANYRGGKKYAFKTYSLYPFLSADSLLVQCSVVFHNESKNKMI